MSAVQWLEFLGVNCAAAAAIAADACVLVVVRFREMRNVQVAMQWALAVGATHIILPFVGFAGGFLLLQRKWAGPAAVYALGSVAMAILLIHVLKEGRTPQIEAKTAAAEPVGGIGFWLAVFGVSIDALLSGPGKVVLLERYPPDFAWLSFLIVGGLVGLFVAIAGWLATCLNRRWLEPTQGAHGLARVMTAGFHLELALFAFFLVWSGSASLRHVGVQMTPLQLAFIWSLLAGALSLKCHSSVWTCSVGKATAHAAAPQPRPRKPRGTTSLARHRNPRHSRLRSSTD
jgi:hypothetical protein